MTTAQRIVLRGLSALVGLALLAAAGLGIGQVVAGLAGDDDFIVPTSRWYAALRSTPWDAPETVYAGIGLLVGGAVLVLVSLLSRPRLFRLTRPTDGVDVVVAPRAVAQMLRRQAEAVHGVATASVEVTKDVARVSVLAPMVSPARVERDLEEALTHALKKIPWSRVPRIDLEVIGDGPPAPAGAAAGAPSGAGLPGAEGGTAR